VAVTTAKVCGSGGVRAVIADNLLLKQQLIVLRRARLQAPDLTRQDRLLCGVWSLFQSPGRIRKVAIGIRPLDAPRVSSAVGASQVPRLFSSSQGPKTPGPKGPSKALIEAIVELKSRNPRFGCPRIARILSHIVPPIADGRTVAHANLNHVRWVSHFRDLVQLPAAA
jgi:putative transposase